MLKITTPYGELKYGEDIEIPLTITNPMFNDRGSYSMPFTCSANAQPDSIRLSKLVEQPHGSVGVLRLRGGTKWV